MSIVYIIGFLSTWQTNQHVCMSIKIHTGFPFEETIQESDGPKNMWLR